MEDVTFFFFFEPVSSNRQVFSLPMIPLSQHHSSPVQQIRAFDDEADNEPLPWLQLYTNNPRYSQSAEVKIFCPSVTTGHSDATLCPVDHLLNPKQHSLYATSTLQILEQNRFYIIDLFIVSFVFFFFLH